MKNLIIVCPDASRLAAEDQTAFRTIRRSGLGASDSATLLGVSPFADNNWDTLVAQKCSPIELESEARIGQMVNVRKGSDLEPIIIDKFCKRYNVSVAKPEPMYNIEGTKLNVNFDGLLYLLEDYPVPVEAKYISPYAGKSWDFTKALGHESLSIDPFKLEFHADLQTHIERNAALCGVPIYYYTQIQQQILAAGAHHGYITAIWDKDWELYTFMVPADGFTHTALIERSKVFWELVEARQEKLNNY